TNTRLKKDIPSLITGRFHKQKRPNTKRYFQFSDGHELRLHFSPTDDGEHRAILPMLWTAKAGDTIRISMFGSGGVEGVRALQAAAARGVKIQIVLDNVTGSGLYSWIKDSEGNFMEENPYAPGNQQVQDNIKVRLNNWPGLNHQKTATLTRANGRVETLIVGSQNWSLSGNDTNDENMVTIRHKTQSVKAGEAFNENFDKFMYPLALSIRLTADGKIEKFGGDEVKEMASIPAD
ncbi:MAG: phospholipase D-like domain-containing protein, partial [Pseudobdellovibrionaceae bacterium]